MRKSSMRKRSPVRRKKSSAGKYSFNFRSSSEELGGYLSPSYSPPSMNRPPSPRRSRSPRRSPSRRSRSPRRSPSRRRSITRRARRPRSPVRVFRPIVLPYRTGGMLGG